MKVLGSRLKSLRSVTGKSQQNVGNDIGIPQTTYASYELDKTEPNHNMLLLLSEYYNVSIDYLLGKTDIKYNQDEINFFNELKDKDINQLIHEYNITLGDEAMSEKDERILIKLIKSFMEGE